VESSSEEGITQRAFVTAKNVFLRMSWGIFLFLPPQDSLTPPSFPVCPTFVLEQDEEKNQRTSNSRTNKAAERQSETTFTIFLRRHIFLLFINFLFQVKALGELLLFLLFS